MKRSYKVVLGVGLAGVVIAFSNLSQSAQAQFDPSRIEQQITPPDPSGRPADISIPAPEGVTAPAGADEQRFQLDKLIIEGATVFSEEELRATYESSLGQEISLADLYDIARQITQKYRSDGYILSVALVPEQVVEDGTARIQVVEGYIESIDFDQAPPRLLNRLQQYSSKITNSRPLRVSTLERTLLLMNDLAGVEVRSILRRGDELGTAILVIRAEYDALDPFFEITNRGSEEVGNTRLQAGIHFNSPFGQGERFTLRSATSLETPEELALGSLSLDIPVGTDGLSINLGGNYTEVNPGGALELIDLNGRTFVGDLGVSYPLVRSRVLDVFLSGGVDYSDTRNITDLTAPATVLSQDRIAAVRTGLEFRTQDVGGSFFGGFQVSQGFAGTTPNNATEPLSRATGSAIFTKASINVGRLQRLPENLRLLFQGDSQISLDSLLVREQFGLGGPTFGSAFNPDSVLGDSGFGLRVELQRPIEYQGLGRAQLTMPYIFSDFGTVYRQSPTALESSRDTRSSAGFGVRHAFGSQLNLALEVAFPIEETNVIDDTDPRLFFTVSGIF